MNKKNISLSTKNMVATTKGSNLKNKILSCSTPEHEVQSPSRDSDSLCDSEATSPVPFLCTQDGADGETDVVWNYYTPKSDNISNSRVKNTTPLSRRARKIVKQIPVEKPVLKRRGLRSTQKNTELFQELLELNQNLHKLIEKKPNRNSSPQNKSETDEDIFNSSSNSNSPKSGLKTNKRCLRKNLLSSKFSKPEPDTALESDDSMNECLLKASQIVEEKILKCDPTDFQDSMDSILNNIRLDSPVVSKIKTKSPGFNNDSFDNFVGNMNDSALERLTQMPVKNTPLRSNKITDATSDWVLQDLRMHESSPTSRNIFGRHNSMPESPSVDPTKPSTSGMIFGRHSSMPFNQNPKITGPGDSPIRCTPDEIRKKHIQAREKLLAKRLLPFTSTQQSMQCTQIQPEHVSAPKKPCFQPRVPKANLQSGLNTASSLNNQLVFKPEVPKQTDSQNDTLKQLIEKKRQEALMKLRRKQKS